MWSESLSPAELTERSQSDSLLERPDAAVVGGGIAGLATAHFLAASGLSVQVLEQKTVGAGATGAGLGGIWPNHRSDPSPKIRQLARKSRDLWARLGVRPEFRFDWRVNGLLDVTPPDLAAAESHVPAILDEGGSVTAVDAGQISHLEPALRSGLSAGLHYPSEAHLNPLKAALSFARATRKAGGRITNGARVLSASVSSGRVMTLETTAGTLSPGCVVIASGDDLDWARPWIQVPLRAVSGQVVATDPLPPLIRSAIQGRLMLVQLRTGEILAGSNQSEGNCATPDESVSREFAEIARELMPALKDIPFPHAWCATRAATPGERPLVTRAEPLANVWLTVGHFRQGLLLGPILGQLLAQSIVQNAISPELPSSVFGQM